MQPACPPSPDPSGVFEVFFGVVFTAEILLRVVALGREAFYTKQQLEHLCSLLSA